jgi:hypothetical protein
MQQRNGLNVHLINSVMPGNRTFPDEEDENNIPGLGAGESTENAELFMHEKAQSAE